MDAAGVSFRESVTRDELPSLYFVRQIFGRAIGPPSAIKSPKHSCTSSVLSVAGVQHVEGRIDHPRNVHWVGSVLRFDAGVFRRPPSLQSPFCEPEGYPHRIARVLALSHKLDELVRSGEVTDHGELARLGHVSPARRCQYMTLLHRAPAIQQYLLLLAVAKPARSRR